MKPAFDLAVEISNYAGKLYDIATNPDLTNGETPVDYTTLAVQQYADPSKTIVAGEVPNAIAHLFKDVAAVVGENQLDPRTRLSLMRSLKTLNKVLEMGEPAAGSSESFGHLQTAVAAELINVKVAADEMKLAFE